MPKISQISKNSNCDIIGSVTSQKQQYIHKYKSLFINDLYIKVKYYIKMGYLFLISKKPYKTTN